MPKTKIKRKLNISVDNNIKKASVEKTTEEQFLREEIFGMKVPSDLFTFWNFCKEYKEKLNEESILPNLNFVGPLKVLTSIDKFPNKNKFSIEHLMKDRHYFDPPEMTTILSHKSSSYHIGVLKDDPNDTKCIYVSNTGEDCKLKILGDNIFSAVNYYLTTVTSVKKQDLVTKLTKCAEENEFSLELKSNGVNERNKKIVSKCFHGAGIVVPVENEVGYRPLNLSNAELKKVFDKIDKAQNDTDRVKEFEKIQETVTYIQFANDECDYGMGLEMGIDMLCHGSKYLNKTISRLLTTAYKLLNRDIYAVIIEEHMKNRLKK